jgi:transposase
MFTAPATLPDDPATLQLILRAALTEIERLQLLIAGLQRNRFGRRSEKLDDNQVQQGVEDLEQSLAEQQARLEAAATAEGSTTPKPDATAASRQPQPAKRNRGALPAHLPRIEVIVDVADKACPCCGGTMHVIGEDRAEMLDFVPAQVRVKVIRRPRHGCRARLPKVPSAEPMEWQTRAAKAQSSRRPLRKGRLMAAWRLRHCWRTS